MQQSKISSFIEVLLNVFIGYIFAVVTQLIIFPQFDIHISLGTNLHIGMWFMSVAIVRGYIIRRYFNAKLHAAAEKLANRSTAFSKKDVNS